jgi:dipeptide/tripeptide permease
VMAFVFLTIGEILIYGTGLEYSYAAAPATMKGFVTGCFLAIDAVANFADGFLTHLYGGSLTGPVAERGPMSAFVFFASTALVVLGATFAFSFIARQMNRRIQSSSSEMETPL